MMQTMAMPAKTAAMLPKLLAELRMRGYGIVHVVPAARGGA